MDYLISSNFQGVNRIIVLLFENDDDRTGHTRYYLQKVEIKDYNVEINVRHFFDQTINDNTKVCENIRRIGTGKEDDFTFDCLLDYPYFKENYMMIAIDLSQQQALYWS